MTGKAVTCLLFPLWVRAPDFLPIAFRSTRYVGLPLHHGDPSQWQRLSLQTTGFYFPMPTKTPSSLVLTYCWSNIKCPCNNHELWNMMIKQKCLSFCLKWTNVYMCAHSPTCTHTLKVIYFWAVGVHLQFEHDLWLKNVYWLCLTNCRKWNWTKYYSLVDLLILSPTSDWF